MRHFATFIDIYIHFFIFIYIFYFHPGVISKKYLITTIFAEIIRIDDYNYELTNAVETDNFYTLRNSDYAEVKCESQTGKQ